MKNFKEIAEKCLAGELKGTFKNRKGDSISSEALCRYSSKTYPYSYYYSDWVGVTIYGDFFKSGKFSEYDIIDFISDNMQEQIKIDIPEGKVPVMEQTENGIVITWKKKELTYNDISNYNWEHGIQIGVLTSTVVNENTTKFSKKVEVLRKLIMIRNYFGKCDKTKRGYHICQNLNHYDYSYEFIVRELCINDPHEVVFAKKEHAEQAIKMLGDELKYLFEPW